MTLYPGRLGDQGQRFQVKYSRDEDAMDDEHTLGYAETREGAERMAAAWRLRPQRPFVWIVDREAPVVNEKASETSAVGIQVSSAAPAIQTVKSATADRARITITIPALFETNTQNGDLTPSRLHLQIRVRPSGGTYCVAVDDVIHGKCTSAYQRSYVIALPNALSGTSAPTSWDIQMIKVTQDSAVLSTQNTLVWATYELLIARRLRIDHHATSISLQRNMVE